MLAVYNADTLKIVEVRLYCFHNEILMGFVVRMLVKWANNLKCLKLSGDIPFEYLSLFEFVKLPALRELMLANPLGTYRAGSAVSNFTLPGTLQVTPNQQYRIVLFFSNVKLAHLCVDAF